MIGLKLKNSLKIYNFLGEKIKLWGNYPIDKAFQEDFQQEFEKWIIPML